MKLSLYKKYTFELKTKLSKEELFNKLSNRASFNGNKFSINDEPFLPIPRSNVDGEILIKDGFIVIILKIYASIFIELFSYAWLGGLGLGLISFIIKSIITFEYYSEIHILIIMCLIGYIFLKILYKMSIDIQEESIRKLINSNQKNG